MFKISKPGQPTLKLEQRYTDSVVYVIDCSELLIKDEILFGNLTILSSSDSIEISEARTIRKHFIQFRATGVRSTLPYVDSNIVFLATTSTGSRKSIPVQIRSYK